MAIEGRHQAKDQRALGANGGLAVVIRYPSDARRIAAAVSAVEGIPTAMLENGLIRSVLSRHASQLFAEVPGLQGLEQGSVSN